MLHTETFIIYYMSEFIECQIIMKERISYNLNRAYLLSRYIPWL